MAILYMMCNSIAVFDNAPSPAHPIGELATVSFIKTPLNNLHDDAALVLNDDFLIRPSVENPLHRRLP